MNLCLHFMTSQAHLVHISDTPSCTVTDCQGSSTSVAQPDVNSRRGKITSPEILTTGGGGVQMETLAVDPPPSLDTAHEFPFSSSPKGGKILATSEFTQFKTRQNSKFNSFTRAFQCFSIPRRGICLVLPHTSYAHGPHISSIKHVTHYRPFKYTPPPTPTHNHQEHYNVMMTTSLTHD